MILFGYTDNYGILLGDLGTALGLFHLGARFSSWCVVSKILSIELRVNSPAQDGVQLSRWSLFCFLLQFPSTEEMVTQKVHQGITFEGIKLKVLWPG